MSGADNDVIYFKVDELTTSDTIDGGNGTDTLALTDAGTLTDADFTHITSVEILDLADGANDITLGTEADAAGITTVIGGTGNDKITTYSNDVDRAALTIDLSEGGNDKIVFDNNVSYASPLGSDTFGVNDGFVNGSVNGLGGDSVFGLGQYYNSTTRELTTQAWESSQDGVGAAQIYDFTAGSGVGRDQIASSFNTGFVEAINPTTTDLQLVSSGAVLEINAAAYSLNTENFTNLRGVATMLDSLQNVNDGVYYIVVYNDISDENADAALYVARATEGDGFDFADTNGITGGLDTDSVELVGILYDVGVNSLSSDNFTLLPV